MAEKSIGLKEGFKSFYMCFLVVYMIVREVIPLHFLIDNIAVSVFVFLMGFALILWDFLTDRECFKGRPADFFIVFLIISVISSVINYKYGVGANIKCIAAMVLEYFVFFPAGFKKESFKTLEKFLNTLIITLFFFVAVSILMYIFSIDYSVMTDRMMDQGFNTTWGRLWGVFNDPNVICYIALIAVFASVYFMYTYRRVWAYILYGINLFFTMAFIVLVVSRSTMVIMFILLPISAVYPFIAFINYNKKAAFGSVAAALVVTVGIMGVYLGLQEGMPYVKSAVLRTVGVSGREKVVTAYDNFYKACGIEILNISDNHITVNPEDPEDALNKITKIEVIERKDNKEDHSNGRIARWKGGIEVFKTTPIIGTSPRNAVAIAHERTPDTVMGKYGWITHCSYLEVLVNTGILGALVMFGCLIYIAVLFLWAAFKKEFNAKIYLTLLCFIAVAMGVFFVSDVFFVFSVNALLFFYLLGFLYGYSGENKNGFFLNSFA